MAGLNVKEIKEWLSEFKVRCVTTERFAAENSRWVSGSESGTFGHILAIDSTAKVALPQLVRPAGRQPRLSREFTLSPTKLGTEVTQALIFKSSFSVIHGKYSVLQFSRENHLVLTRTDFFEDFSSLN